MAGDHWLGESDLATLARLLRRQREIDQKAPSMTPPVRTQRVELFIGTDAEGRLFLTRSPVPEADPEELQPEAAWRAYPPPPVESVRGPIEAWRWKASLLAGACGDALGAPIESKSMAKVREMTGPDGILDFIEAYNGIGKITDDTQMTLFTLEALIRAHAQKRFTGETDVRYALQLGYQRWLHTQGVSWAKARGPRETSEEPDGWLITHKELHHRRAPGQTCFFSLKGFGSGTAMGTFSQPINNSKGCGGVMRAGPAALWSEDVSECFEIGAMSAALTHSHPSGYLAAGVFAAMEHQLLRGVSFEAALATARSVLVGWSGHEEQSAALDAAVALAAEGSPSPEKTATLGGGGVGESAMAIAVYALLVTDNLQDAILVAVNHGGDSDSTASIAGNLGGAFYGADGLRPNWVEQVQFREVIEQMAEDALAEFGPQPPTGADWEQRYPTGAAVAAASGPSRAERFRGSILAGALGDTLGAAHEFDPMERIRQKHGQAGIVDLVPAFGAAGRITDDTQMTLFTMEGLLRAHAHQRAGGTRPYALFLQDAYQRWLHTQGVTWVEARGPQETSPVPDGWLIGHRDLFDRRAPGATCYSELKRFGVTGELGSKQHVVNDSKGCGGVMRAAPAALWPQPFEAGEVSAALTHGHVAGYQSAGALAVIVDQLLDGRSLTEAVGEAERQLSDPETLEALRLARQLAAEGPPTPERIATIPGGGWIGESALAIAVYVALSTDDLESALLASVNHDGDSDSTGAVCGNIVGAMYGPDAIRRDWLEQLELRDAIEELIADTLAEFGPEPPEWGEKYPTNATVVSAPAAQPVRQASVLDSLTTLNPEPAGPSPRDDRFRGSILAGALGDALGAADEFESIETIRQLRGPAGLTGLVPSFGKIGAITDDTQMTLFTMEGLIRAHAHRRRGGQLGVERFVQSAYQRWLHTQDYAWADCRGPGNTSTAPDGWLIGHRDLFARRAPGKTCLSALMAHGHYGKVGSFTESLNTSKGCGGVMRTAPAALWPGDPAEVFRVGAMAAALTHSHVTGYLSAGALSLMVRQLIDGLSLRDALGHTFDQLSRWPGHEETLNALRFAVQLASQGPPTPEKIATIHGGGWIGESALAIAVYVALTTNDADTALLAAVNHSGDSDSTGAICGNLVGAMYGSGSLPQRWLERLELRDTIEELIADGLAEFGPTPPTHSLWEGKYPNS